MMKSSELTERKVPGTFVNWNKVPTRNLIRNRNFNKGKFRTNKQEENQEPIQLTQQINIGT